MSKPLKLAMFLGSVREGRNADRVAKFALKHIASTNHQVEVIDPLKYKLPLLEKPLHHYKDRSEAPKVLHDIYKIANEADAFFLISAEYNHIIPPALCNMIDHIALEALVHKPCAIVTYSMGGFAGTRAGVTLRSIMAGVGGFCIPSTLGVPSVHQTLDEEGNTENQFLHSGFQKLGNELYWYADALRTKRGANGLPK